MNTVINYEQWHQQKLISVPLLLCLKLTNLHPLSKFFIYQHWQRLWFIKNMAEPEQNICIYDETWHFKAI